MPADRLAQECNAKGDEARRLAVVLAIAMAACGQLGRVIGGIGLKERPILGLVRIAIFVDPAGTGEKLPNGMVDRGGRV